MLCAVHNWLLTHYDAIHDFAAPLATILAAFAAVSVTLHFSRHQKKIAADQAITAKEKLRLDLYNKRFEIFSSVFDFYDAMIAWGNKGTPEQIAARTKFFRAYQESGFLFKPESGIEALLKMLNDKGNEVIGFKEHSENYKSDPVVMIEQLRKTTDIQTKVFEEGLAKLRIATHPYLDFSKL